MRDHTDITGLMSMELDGMLSVEESEALDAHLAECADCRAEWIRWRRIDSLLSAEPAIDPAAGFSNRVLERIDGEVCKERRRLTAAVVIGGGLSVWFLAILSLLIAVALWWLTDPLVRLQAAKVLSQLVPPVSTLCKAASALTGAVASVQAVPWVAALAGWVATITVLWALLLQRQRRRVVIANG